MKLLWEHPLPTDEKSFDALYEGPIHVQGKLLYTVTGHRGLTLHVVDTETGTASHRYTLSPGRSMLPIDCFFIPFGEDVVLCCHHLVRLRKGELDRELFFPEMGELTSHLVLGNRLYLTYRGLNASLFCVDLENFQIRWQTGLRGQGYDAGPVTAFGDQLACCGRDALLTIDPETGAVLGERKLSRISKLFQPVDLGDNRLLLGYSNFSSAGVLCLNTATNKILWRHRRNFEGPLNHCRLIVTGERVYWQKNETEICCVSLADGSEQFRARTDPWLYTTPELTSEGLIFGTSGADGFLRCLDPETGAERWKLPLKNGCFAYARQGDTLLTGDFTGRLFQLRAGDGALLQTFDTGTEVVGQYHVHNGSLYTVIWGNEALPCRLIRVEI